MTRAKDFHHDAWWDHDRPSGILHLARDLAGEARVRSRSLNERGAKAYVAGEVLLRAHPERLWADIIGSFDGWPEDCREPLPRT